MTENKVKQGAPIALTYIVLRTRIILHSWRSDAMLFDVLGWDSTYLMLKAEGWTTCRRKTIWQLFSFGEDQGGKKQWQIPAFFLLYLSLEVWQTWGHFLHKPSGSKDLRNTLSECKIYTPGSSPSCFSRNWSLYKPALERVNQLAFTSLQITFRSSMPSAESRRHIWSPRLQNKLKLKPHCSNAS